MNKIISISVLSFLLGGTVIVSEAAISLPRPAAGNSSQLSQILFPRRNRRHGGFGRNERVRYETVTVRKGRKLFRDTYKITFKNGQEKRKRIEHVRIA